MYIGCTWGYLFLLLTVGLVPVIVFSFFILGLRWGVYGVYLGCISGVLRKFIRCTCFFFGLAWLSSPSRFLLLLDWTYGYVKSVFLGIERTAVTVFTNTILWSGVWNSRTSKSSCEHTVRLGSGVHGVYLGCTWGVLRVYLVCI